MFSNLSPLGDASRGWGGGWESSEHYKRMAQNQNLRLFLTFLSLLNCHLLPSPQACLHRGHEVMTCHTLICSTIFIITPAMPKPCPLFDCDSLISGSSRIASGHDDIQSLLLCQQCLQLGIFKFHNLTVTLTVYFL